MRQETDPKIIGKLVFQELKIGISEKSIFDVYHPDAMDLYNVCSILSKVDFMYSSGLELTVKQWYNVNVAFAR